MPFVRRLVPVLVLVPALAGAATTPTPPLRLGDEAVPKSYAAKLEVDPESSTFSGSIDIEMTVRKPTTLVWLHGTDLTVDKAWFEVAGKKLDASAVPVDNLSLGFRTATPLAAGPARLHVEYRGKVSNNESRGLFHEQAYGSWYAGTQLESIYGRRVFPCFDEPGFKTPWQLTLDVDKDLVAVSNTYPTRTTVNGKRKIVEFGTTKPLPSYLLAFGVGPFDLVDAGKAGKNHVPLRLAVPHGRAADAKRAAQLFPQIVERLEAYFGIPYPYPKLDIFSMPLSDVAMENAGLIMTPEPTLVAKPTELSFRFEQGFVNLMLHEIGHQWFGDLVTCAWWDDVWLNESFATWITTKLAEEWHPEWRHGTQAVTERGQAISNDQLASARQVHQPVRSTEEILNYVDEITYEKGSSVLNMFEGWIGADKWRAGIHDYLTAHADGNATFADFVKAISAAAGRDLMPSFSSFVDQTGVPLLTMSLSCGGKQPTVTLSQQRYVPLGSPGSDKQTWQIPVCMRWSAGGQAGHSCTLVSQPKATVALETGGRCPDWIQANDGGRGYYRTNYQGDLLGKLMKDATHQQSLPEIISTLGDIVALVKNGTLLEGDALATLPPLAADPRREPVMAAAGLVTSLRAHLVPAALRPNYARFVQKLFGDRARSLGWKPRPNDDEDTRALRSELVPIVADYGEDGPLRAQAIELSKAWLRDRHAISPEMTFPVLVMAARAGDAALFDAFLATARTADRGDRDHLLRALASFRKPELVKRLLDLVLDPSFDAREMTYLPFIASRWPDNVPLVWDFVQSHYAALVKRLTGETMAYYTQLVADACDAGHRASREAFFKPHLPEMPGSVRLLQQAVEESTVCERTVEKQAPSVAAFLGKY